MTTTRCGSDVSPLARMLSHFATGIALILAAGWIGASPAPRFILQSAAAGAPIWLTVTYGVGAVGVAWLLAWVGYRFVQHSMGLAAVFPGDTVSPAWGPVMPEGLARRFDRLCGHAIDRRGRPVHRVRVLEMTGAMSHVVRSDRRGTVIRRENRASPIDGMPFPLVLVRFDDGAEEWIPAMPRDWLDQGSHALRIV